MTIEEVFQEYLRTAFGGRPVPEWQREELRKSFYAGAFAILRPAINRLDDIPEEEGIAFLEGLQDEIQDFFHEGESIH
jgi:hypothetical protein